MRAQEQAKGMNSRCCSLALSYTVEVTESLPAPENESRMVSLAIISQYYNQGAILHHKELQNKAVKAYYYVLLMQTVSAAEAFINLYKLKYYVIN